MGTVLTVVLCVIGAAVGIWILWVLVQLAFLIAVSKRIGKELAKGGLLDGPVKVKYPVIERRAVKGRLA